MTLYTQASSNVRKTWALLTGFFVLIIAIGWLFSYAYQSPGILVFAVIISIVMSVTSYWFSDKIVLASAGAKPIEKKDNQELYRLVENLTIAAGLPMPKLYVIPTEAPNAFATGRDKEHAVVAVTQGLLDIMNKQELEGVLAHELSHIGNKDMLVSMVVVVLVGVISLLADWFLRMSFFGGRRDDRDSGGNIMFILGIVGAILAPIAATLIQLAISRKREFLADASGALLTRYPEGLASALQKLEANPYGMKASSATAHLYFASPFKADRGEKDSKKIPWVTKLFMTHPPIEERIRVLRQMSI